MLKMSLEPKSIKPRRINRAKVANDNAETVWSGLTFREKTEIKKRVKDLNWQKTYAEIHLNRTQALTEERHTAFLSLYHRANNELNKLSEFG